MPKETLVERMNQKRLDAKNASDKDVADYIWREIKWIFDLIDGYQLEQVDYLTVTVEEKVDSIKIDITVKESYEASDYTEEVIITAPTGGNKSLTYVIVAVVVLAAAGVVIFVIRRFKK